MSFQLQLGVHEPIYIVLVDLSKFNLCLFTAQHGSLRFCIIKEGLLKTS